MATQLQLTLRRDDAYARIDEATRKLEQAAGVKRAAGESIRHRDPAIEQILRIEAIADSLEALVQAQGQGRAKAAAAEQPPLTVETVVEKPLETVETVEIVESDKAADAPKGKGKK